MVAKIREFATRQDAWDWLEEEIDDPCVDNHRMARADDAQEVHVFWEKDHNGCCGSYNADILIGGIPHLIGCNYGH